LRNRRENVDVSRGIRQREIQRGAIVADDLRGSLSNQASKIAEPSGNDRDQRITLV
jgi:hypothetical protein